MSLSICGCQSSDNKKIGTNNVTIRFSWWGGESRHDKTMKVIEKFEEKYPDIKVKTEFAEWKGFNKKMSMNIAGNEEPDLMQINYDWLEAYSKDGSGFYSLNSVSDVLKLDNYSKEILKYGTKNNVLNGIPISMNKQVFYYNEDLGEKYSIKNFSTWDELLNSRSKVSDENQYPLELDEVSGWALPMAYVQQKNGKDFIKEDGTLGFNGEDIKELLTFYKTLVDNKVIPMTLHKDANDLSDNKSVSGFSWTSDATKIQDLMEKNNKKAGFGNIPSIDGKTSLRYVKPSMLYAMSKNTEHPKETALLLNFILNDEDAAEIQGFDRGVPASNTAIKALEADNKLSGLQYEATKEDSNVKEILISPYYENTLIQSICVDALSKVAYGKASIDQCAKETYDSLNRTLDTIRK
jgi:oligogalacturonide transport system substrate-binding protein